MRFVRENSLSLFFLTIFLATLVGQSFAGQHAFNEEQLAHGAQPVTWTGYVLSSSFGSAVMENWQSEFLQFSLLILATVWLFQRGSTESKTHPGLDSKQKMRVEGYAPENAPRWAKVRGWRRWLYENSLLLAMLTVFFWSWGAQSVTSWREYDATQREHDQPPVTWATYVTRADFWEKSLQNWQSEFLAVGTMAVFSIYLRQHSSAESKPVGAPHDETGTSG
jgi:hypothetical protein